jgi:hypothetical protein
MVEVEKPSTSLQHKSFLLWINHDKNGKNSHSVFSQPKITRQTKGLSARTAVLTPKVLPHQGRLIEGQGPISGQRTV